MSRLLPDSITTLLDVMNPPLDPVLDEMEEYGTKRGFPTVGPEVGQFLTVAARMVSAKRIFEFGSGFGYSAAWFARALPPDGELYLTDYDETNLERASEYLDRLGYEGTLHVHAGTAIENFETVEGSFDVLLVDLDKQQYVDALRSGVDRVEPGGIIIADNMMEGPVSPESVIGALEGNEPVDAATAGIARYIEAVRSLEEFETVFLPIGEGIAVSVRTE